jgi:DNA-binding response OmpR family regulator
MHVLLVEDNPDDALLIEEMMLSATVGEIEHASTLSSALEILTRKDFSLVLLDLSLPDSSVPDSIMVLRKHAPSTLRSGLG